MLRAALRRSGWAQPTPRPDALVHELLRDSDILSLVGFNTHSGVEFYHLESMSELLWTLFAVSLIRLLSTSPLGGRTAQTVVEESYRVISELDEANRYAQGRAKLLLSKIAQRPPAK
jgi:hypothetical protein